MDILNAIGASEEAYENATGETAKEFQTLPAGIYKAKIKDILIYTNKWDGKQMRYTVVVKDSNGEERELSFKSDIGSHLKDKSENKGYANRLKQFCYATGVDASDLTIKEKAAKINSFGQEYEADAIMGMNNKVILAQVLLMSDTNKAEGESFKYTNILSGVLAKDGTDASGEDKQDAFKEKCEKTPVTEYAGYVKQNSQTQAQTNTSTEDLAESDF